jgi:hypothetical protein
MLTQHTETTMLGEVHMTPDSPKSFAFQTYENRTDAVSFGSRPDQRCIPLPHNNRMDGDAVSRARHAIALGRIYPFHRQLTFCFYTVLKIYSRSRLCETRLESYNPL